MNSYLASNGLVVGVGMFALVFWLLTPLWIVVLSLLSAVICRVILNGLLSYIKS